MCDIVHHAAERFIEVVPEIDSPGHMQAAIAARPWLGVSGNLPWNFQLWTDNAKVVTRPKATPAGEFHIHLDSCDGPLLATLPLAGAAQTKLQTTLTTTLPATSDEHILCIHAIGDPRDGLWAIGQIELLKQ